MILKPERKFELKMLVGDFELEFKQLNFSNNRVLFESYESVTVAKQETQSIQLALHVTECFDRIVPSWEIATLKFVSNVSNDQHTAAGTKASVSKIRELNFLTRAGSTLQTAHRHKATRGIQSDKLEKSFCNVKRAIPPNERKKPLASIIRRQAMRIIMIEEKDVHLFL